MKIRFTNAPTFTKAIIAAAVFAIAYLVAAVLLLALKNKNSILGRQASAQQAHEGPSAQALVPRPVPGRGSSFCAKCGTRIITGDRFCQGCGAPIESRSFAQLGCTGVADGTYGRGIARIWAAIAAIG